MTLARSNASHEGLIFALDYYCRNVLRLANVVCVRLAKGLHRLKKMEGNNTSLMLYWHADDGDDLLCYESEGTGVHVQAVDGNYQHARIMQLVLGNASEQLVDVAKSQEQTPYEPAPRNQDIGAGDEESTGRLSTVDEDSQEDAESIASFLAANFGNATQEMIEPLKDCLLYTSPSPRDGLLSRMPSSA